MITQHLKTFGQNSRPNTIIGGIGATINTPALLASKLGINAGLVSGFKIINNDIECAIANMSVFNISNSNITYFKGYGSAYNDINTRIVNTPLLEIIELPNTTINRERLAYQVNSVKEIIMPKLTTDMNGNMFSSMTNLELFDVRSFVIPQDKITNNWFFSGLKVGCVIKISIVNKTNYNGVVSPTLTSAKNRGYIIEFYDANGNYVSTL